MEFTKEIFERATIHGVANYLLYGQSPGKEVRNYETRLGDAFAEFDNAVLHCDEQKKPLIEAVNALISESANVYTEIGLQAGFLVLQDMVQNLREQNMRETETDRYRIMYDMLFREVNCALVALQKPNDENVDKAINILKEGQSRAEEIQIKAEE